MPTDSTGTKRKDLSAVVLRGGLGQWVGAVAELMDAAWSADYPDSLRAHYDAPLLDRLTQGPDSVAVLIMTDARLCVGFGLGQARDIRWNGISLKARYSTALTVSPAHQRKGIGQWIAAELVGSYDKVPYDVGMMTFHHGHAGRRTIERASESAADRGMVSLYTAPIWSMRLLGNELPAPNQPARASALALRDSRLVLQDSGNTLGAQPARPGSLIRFEDAYRDSRWALLAEFDRDFAAMYMTPATRDGGSLLYELASGRICLIAFRVTAGQFADMKIDRIAQIQAVFHDGCEPHELQGCLAHLCRYLQTEDCFSISMPDQGAVPGGTLSELGFQGTGETLELVARGTQSQLQHFSETAAPCCVDFI